jgi:MoxR-like ATPase
VLLIDELDRADEEFEAFLLELLSDFQITVPEVGTFSPQQPPAVVITSNRTREIHDALKRRCLYHWIEYPTSRRSLRCCGRACPDAARACAAGGEPGAATARMDLYKLPGVAETLDWAAALLALEQQTLTVEVVSNTLGALLKHQEDIERLQGQTLAVMVQKAQQQATEQGAQGE